LCHNCNSWERTYGYVLAVFAQTFVPINILIGTVWIHLRNVEALCWFARSGANLHSKVSIIDKLVVAPPTFAKCVSPYAIVDQLLIRNSQPNIREFVLPTGRELINECWEGNSDNRPSFDNILNRMERMKLNLRASINWSKLFKFIEKIQDWEPVSAKQALACSQLMSIPFQPAHKLRYPSLPRKTKCWSKTKR
jgi:hypothetical protein